MTTNTGNPNNQVPPRAVLQVDDNFTPLRKLAPGDRFEDVTGQQFVLLEVKPAGRCRYQVECTWSKQGYKQPGPMSAAFSSHIGAVLYLSGSQEVLRAASPVIAVDFRAQLESEVAA